MRSIVQPGPPAPERIQWVEARGRAFSFTLEAGLPLLEAARRGFAAEGFAGGVLNIKGGALGPFAYVMPALSKTGDNAAFYSDTFRPAGVTRLKMAAMTLGERDGAPFFHCHALWTEADGRPAAAISCPRRPWSPSPLRWKPSASTARSSRRSRTPRPISNCSGRCPQRHGCGNNEPRLRAAAAAEPGFCRRAGSLLPGARDFPRQASWRRRQHHRRALYRWPHRRAVRDRTGG